MTPNDVDTFLSEFPVNTKKLFAYKQEFLVDEYLYIEKNEGQDACRFNFIVDETTIDTIPNLVDKVTGFIIQDELKRLMVCEQLKEYKGDKWYTTLKSYKTDGCDMGCWSTSNPNVHSFDCRRYGKG